MSETTNKQIDRLFDSIDFDLRNGHYNIVDGLLQTVDVATEPIDMLIAYLSITLAAKNVLPSRTMLHAMTQHRLEKERGQKAADWIMRGLG